MCVCNLYNFLKWFEPVLLNLDHFPWISTIRGGGTLCSRKHVLFSTQSNKKSDNLGTLPQFLIFVTKHPVKTSFVFSSSYYLAFLNAI